jgi:molybdenum cofactor biosynthesis enzyme MoaA
VSQLVDHLTLYRLPWNLADNGVSWLEPTAHCNLSCDGCYRLNRVEHKPFEETLRELDVFQGARKSDALSIAGGDPLLYPDLVRTVAEARQRGYKPIVNTNGLALTAELAQELKAAGLGGFTFHVDSKQGRPKPWRGKDEIALCGLRDELAELCASVEVSCAFNATVYPDTLEHVPALVRWAEERMDLVDVMVFILYRDMPVSHFRFLHGPDEVELSAFPEAGNGDATKEAAKKKKRGRSKKQRAQKGEVVYNFDSEKSFDDYVTADDVVAKIRESYPDYAPCAYLNGTQDPSTFKWLLAGRVGRPGETLGYVGPKFMELVQSTHHLFTGKYLAYADPGVTRRGKQILLLSPFDRGVRRIASHFLRDALRSPWRALREKLHYQSVIVIQPIDILADGRMNMCDGCPDMTVWGDQLVWSCRMDEQERFGANLAAVPRTPPAEA